MPLLLLVGIYCWWVAFSGIVEGMVERWAELAIQWRGCEMRWHDTAFCSFCQSEGLWVIWCQSPLRRHQIHHRDGTISTTGWPEQSAKSSSRQSFRSRITQFEILKQKAFRSYVVKVKTFEKNRYLEVASRKLRPLLKGIWKLNRISWDIPCKALRSPAGNWSPSFYGGISILSTIPLWECVCLIICGCHGPLLS